MPTPGESGLRAARLPASSCDCGVAASIAPSRPSRLLGTRLRPAGRRLRRRDASTRCGCGGRRRPSEFDFARVLRAGTSWGRSSDQIVGRVGDPRAVPRRLDEGRRASLRFLQEYFLVCCSLQDIVAAVPGRTTTTTGGSSPTRWRSSSTTRTRRSRVAELMRAAARSTTRPRLGRWPGTSRVRTLAYTEPHAPARGAGAVAGPVLRAALPRHLEIIYEINRRFLDDVDERYPRRRSAHRAR